MTTTLAKLGFDIDSGKARTAKRDLDALTDASGRAEKSSYSFASASNAVRNALSGLVAAISVREVINYADVWQNVSNQLRLVTTGTRELAEIQSSLVDVAKDTRSGFESTATLYARLARSTKEMSLSTDELIKLTKTINQSFAISGATAEESASAITQLSQGLAAGALRGEEFNVVAENSPALLRAIGDSLRMNVGELRAFAAQGGITAQVVVNALKKASDEIDQNFNKTVATFGQNIEVARTNLLQWVGASDLVNNGVSSLGESLVKVSENIDTIINVGGAALLIFLSRTAGAATSSGIAYAASMLSKERSTLAAAKATATATAAEVSWLKSIQGSLAAQLAQSKTTADSIRLRAQLAANTTALIAAQNAHTASMGAATLAARGATAAMAGLRGALALVGGPVGLAILAAGAIYYFRDSLVTAKPSVSDAAEEIKKLSEGFKDLTQAELENRRSGIAGQMAANAAAIESARAKLKELGSQTLSFQQILAGYQGGLSPGGRTEEERELERTIKDLVAQNEALEESMKKLQEREKSLSETAVEAAKTKQKAQEDSISKIIESLNNEFIVLKNGDSALVDRQLKMLGASEAQRMLASEIMASTAALRKEKEATEADAAARKAANEELQKYIAGLKDSIDPMAAAEREIKKVWAAFERGDLGSISREQVENYVNGLRDAAQGGAEEMEIEFSRASDRIASSLQNAIISGDWSGMGNAIGGALAGSIADVTSAALAQQIGGQAGSFLGPIGGAIAGGLAGMLANEIFGSNEYTGHRERQERTSELLGGIDERAAEIANATQRSASALDELVGINRELLTAQRGIENASADLGFNVAQQMAELFTRGTVQVQSVMGGGLVAQATRDAKDIGIILSGTIADATVESFLDFKGRIYSESNSVITSTFGDALGSVTDLVREAATALGLSSGDIERAIGGVDLSRFGELSLGGGMGAEEQAQAVNALLATILSDAAMAAIPGLAAFVDRVGESVGEVLQQLATDTQLVTSAMSDLGVSLGELTGLDLAAVSEQLIEAVGGIDAFRSGLSSFYSAFQSEQEQQRIQFERLTDEFANFGLTLPSTSAELMRVAQSLDLTAESGREAFAMLIRTQGELSSYYDTIEQRTANLLSSLTGATDAAFRALQSSVSAERATLTQAYQEEQKAIQAATQARLDANRMAIDAAKEGLSTIKGEVDGLRGVLERLRGSYDPIADLRRSGAIATLRNALATGSLAGVSDAAGIAAQIEASGFATREDFMLEQGRTIGLLEDVEQLGGEQLSTAEKTIKRLEAQTSVIRASGDAQLAALQMGFDQEMARLDSVVSNAEMQLDALRGIDEGLLSIADALMELSKAMSAEAGTQSIENIYRTLLGREADQEGLAYWKSSGLTGDALIEAMRFAAIVNGEVPRFANGGMHSGGLRLVGERGPELELTGSSRIMSNGDLMSALGGSRDTANELKGLREDLRAANRAIVKNGEEIKQIMRQWDQQGLPAERVLA